VLTKANIDGFYYKPRIGFKSLLENHEGLVILTGCAASFLNLPKGKEFFEALVLDKADMYLEVMPHLSDEQKAINNLCIELSEKYSVPIVATNDCHYIKESDAIAQEILLAIQTKAKWGDPKRWRFNIDGLFLRSANQMREAFNLQGVFTPEEIESALDWAEDIFQKCSGFRIEKQDISLPKVPGYENEDPGDFIWNLAESKLREISLDWSDEKFNQYADRLQEEWTLINKKGFSPYFLIVWELVGWCKKNEIMIGPGRGSVGGSLLAYLLNITSVDPIKYKLLFSRFIAEDRLDYPDIDIDFEDRKRHLIREHLEALYGKNHIASLSTFMSMKGRGTVRDVARVFDLPAFEVDEFAKTIIESTENEEGAIEEAFKSELGQAFKEKYYGVCASMLLLEGQIRGCGQHPAAVIVSSQNLKEGDRGNLIIRSDEPVCNWDMPDAEYVGLMKLDILGLNTLSVLNETKRLIEDRTGEKFIFEDISLNDQGVYQQIYEGNTVGLFQISTWALTNLAKKIRATNINELSDIIALVRPGPMDSGMTDEYIARKNSGTWTKKNSIYEEATKNTYGIIVYQEQIMEVINKVAGLPYVEADKIRKIIREF